MGSLSSQMAVSKWSWEAKKTFGKSSLPKKHGVGNGVGLLIVTRGAYCAMVIISLLDLPLDLPPESNARQSGLRTFLDGLPEYLARCMGSHPRYER